MASHQYDDWTEHCSQSVLRLVMNTTLCSGERGWLAWCQNNRWDSCNFTENSRFFHSQVNAAHLELTEWSQVAPVYITVFIICTAIIIIIVVVVVIFKLRVWRSLITCLIFEKRYSSMKATAQARWVCDQQTTTSPGWLCFLIAY